MTHPEEHDEPEISNELRDEIDARVAALDALGRKRMAMVMRCVLRSMDDKTDSATVFLYRDGPVMEVAGIGCDADDLAGMINSVHEIMNSPVMDSRRLN